jgi:hypothetical protein
MRGKHSLKSAHNRGTSLAAVRQVHILEKPRRAPPLRSALAADGL